jgi:uncharacterized protein
MIYFKQLSILIYFVCIITQDSSCQTPKKNTNKQPANSSTEKPPVLPQVPSDNLPQPKGYVNDYENIYSTEEKATLDSLIADFEQTTTIQIVLVTIDTSMIAKDSLDEFTLRIGNAWGVGQKEKNNGIVIGISRGYRKMRIQNGYGIQSILTDEETKKIIDTSFIPGFREGKYYEGTMNGLKNLMETLSKKQE